MYKKNDLTGGHVIKLGPGNDEAAREALSAWPGGLQVGGGIQVSNAQEWIDAGAEKVRRKVQELATCSKFTNNLFLDPGYHNLCAVPKPKVLARATPSVFANCWQR